MNALIHNPYVKKGSAVSPCTVIFSLLICRINTACHPAVAPCELRLTIAIRLTAAFSSRTQRIHTPGLYGWHAWWTGPNLIGPGCSVGKPTGSLRCLERYPSEYLLSRGGGYKLTLKLNEVLEDIKVCTLVRGLVFDADYYQELHARASRGFFQVLRHLPQSEFRCQ